MPQATGPFDVKMIPEASDEAGGLTLGRFALDKRYRGALDATSAGAMLTAMTPVKGSAGYVAVERVTGTLDGRAGSFLLQHSGIMARGAQRLDLGVVPDSGTGALEGLAGTMRIVIEGGTHAYAFDYTLPDGPA
jgi:hypothetical protein